jgi:GNAT superfamily N-acetyltransferase
MDIRFKKAQTDAEIEAVAGLARVIWEEHFTPLIGAAQVAYMLDKFQSFSAIKGQIESGYIYDQIFWGETLAGYTGYHAEADTKKLFLSKLYVHKDFRGNGLAGAAVKRLADFCRAQGCNCVYLTCNKHNSNTLAVYKHLGFVVAKAQVSDIGGGFVMDDYVLELEADSPGTRA